MLFWIERMTTMSLDLNMGGQAVEATRGASFSRLNPVTGRIASVRPFDGLD
jgi:hypothetical protein